MKYLLIDAANLILKVASQPITLGTDKVTNLDNDEVIFEPGSNFTTEEVEDADIPPRFTSRKYMWDGDSIATNPDWVDPQPAKPVVNRAEQVARGVDTHKANVRARAADLRRKGKHLESLSLLKTIGE